MVYRCERPLLRKSIMHIMELYHFSLDELLVQRDIHLGASYKTQVRKMIQELKSQEFLDSLTYENGFPVIYCTEEKGTWSFWCPYCRRKHFHTPYPGHRHCHCHDEKSPFSTRGYILKLRSENE